MTTGASEPTDARLYELMTLSRVLERVLAEANPRWFPAEGEEATIVGSFCDLRTTDVAAPHYRGPFVVYLMRGAELVPLAAQALGRSGGYSQGRSVPFTGPIAANIVPWVAGDLGTSLGVATGAALGLKRSGTDDVVVCTFGDGTANRGDFHESLNVAAVWSLPIVYVCQNNGWAISQRAPSYLAAPVAARAAGYGMPGSVVDGQDIEAVRAAVQHGVCRARTGHGPTLIEAVTIRRRGHWAGDDASYRRPEDVVRWVDPLDVQRARVIERGHVAIGDLREMEARIEREVATAVATARELPELSRQDLAVDQVYR